MLGYLGRVSIRQRHFDQGAPRAAVAGLGDAALATGRSARVLRGDQADEGGQLSRRIEAREVAEFGDDGDRDEPLDPAQGLQRLHDGIKPPGWAALEELCLEPKEPIDLLVRRAHRLLEHDLLRGGRTDDLREVPTMRVGPVRSAHIVPAEREQERFQPEVIETAIVGSGVSGLSAALFLARAGRLTLH
jgi:hypothetical protein